MREYYKKLKYFCGEDISQLSHNELIYNCLLISKEKKAKEKAHLLSLKYPNLVSLFSANSEELRDGYKLNNLSVYNLLLIKEIILRLKINVTELQLDHPFSNYQLFIKYCKAIFKNKSSEILAIFYLDNDWKILCEELISQGDSTKVTFDTIEILRKALLCHAKGVVIAHNHPCKALIASTNDIRYTLELKRQLEVIQILLLDSLIFSEDNYISILKENPIVAKYANSYSIKLNSKQRLDFFSIIKNIPTTIFSSNKKTKSSLQVIESYYKDKGIIISQTLIKEFLQDLNTVDERKEFIKTTNSLKHLNTKAFIYFSYLDENECFQLLNARYSLIFHTNTINILGKKLKDLIGEEGYNICKPYLKRAFKGEECIFRYPWYNIKGTLKHLKLHYIPDKDRNSKIRGIAVFLEPIKNSELIKELSGKSEIFELLPQVYSKNDMEFNAIFFSKTIKVIKQVLKEMNVQFSSLEFLDVAVNVYDQFIESSSIETDYIKAIINNALKSSKLTANSQINITK